ncbi:MAG: Uma2 family endonuclease [Hamadaea sp.]|uniref:Uma2 family endonuclease n=1 Tax=Hamadaea sp. TaxID=2024425 RepID=UPI0017F79920|nr:Uma2 family endonuclease [Hamadaea sp.]NUR70679.1 Uma2 family endonuclease [Hamadaea sp.]NUT17866.1 Uma2 family endonuclease [Hamadaea sp.]
MTIVLSRHLLPWTEQEYFALGETSVPIELLDGSLYVSPAPTRRHQMISGHLSTELLGSADAAGLVVLRAINLRLRPGRVVIPDLVIAEAGDLEALSLSPDEIRLVCEITSPSNAAHDRVTKMYYYAQAGIEWYLLVEPEGPVLQLYHLEGDTYREAATAAPGTPLVLTEPVNVTIDPRDLLPG